MNEISKLTDKITEEATAYAANTRQAAESDAAQITLTYEKQAREETQDALEHAQLQAEAVQRRAESRAGMEARSMKLTARRSLLTQAFADARAAMDSLPEDKLVSFLVAMINKCQTADAQLIFGKGQEALGKKVLAAAAASQKKLALTLSDTVGSFTGGFILKEGAIETNCTFDVLVKSVEEELEAEVAALLLG